MISGSYGKRMFVKRTAYFMVYLFPFFYFQPTYIIILVVSFFWRAHTWFMHFYSLCQDLLTGIFRPVTFNAIIDMLGLHAVIFSYLELLFFLNEDILYMSLQFEAGERCDRAIFIKGG